MYSTVRTAVLDGISAIPVQVEVDISTGMPVFDMVGNLTSEVREAKERVKTALHSVAQRWHYFACQAYHSKSIACKY